MKRIVPAFLLAGLLAGPSTAALAGDGPKHGAMHGERAEKMADWLELSDTQRAELQQLREAHAPQMKAQREKLHELRSAERALDPSADSYVAEVRRIAEERARLQVEHAVTRAEHRQQMAGILSEQQRAKLAEVRAKHKDKDKKRAGKPGMKGQSD